MDLTTIQNTLIENLPYPHQTIWDHENPYSPLRIFVNNIKDKDENEKIKRSWDTVFSNHPQRIETIPKATSTIYKLTYGASIITCTVHCNATLMIQGAHHVDNWTVENIKSICKKMVKEYLKSPDTMESPKPKVLKSILTTSNVLAHDTSAAESPPTPEHSSHLHLSFSILFPLALQPPSV